MKSKIKKNLSIFMATTMMLSAAGAVSVCAEETAAVDITANYDQYSDSTKGTKPLTNVANNDATTTGNYYLENGLIVFTFSEAMDVSTLNEENITIKLTNNTGTLGKIKEKDSEFEYDTETQQWSYIPFGKTETTYTIDLGDMCMGRTVHEVTFSEKVKTASGNSIEPVTEKFQTGHLADLPYKEGKQIVNVAFNKNLSNTDKQYLVTPKSGYAYGPTTTAIMTVGTGGLTVDLGNYYDIAKVDVAVAYGKQSWLYGDVDVYASLSSPITEEAANGDSTLMTKLGTCKSTHIPVDSNKLVVGDNLGGLGVGYGVDVTSLSHTARYIKIAPAGSHHYCRFDVFAYVDTDYGAITASKDEEVVSTFAGAGTYKISCPATEYVADTSDSYMIVAGYDANNKITNLVCEPVELVDGAFAVDATFNANTVSAKATLFKSFAKPQMLTDALILSAAE